MLVLRAACPDHAVSFAQLGGGGGEGGRDIDAVTSSHRLGGRGDPAGRPRCRARRSVSRRGDTDAAATAVADGGLPARLQGRGARPESAPRRGGGDAARGVRAAALETI